MIVHVDPGAIVPLFSVTVVPPLTPATVAEVPHPLKVGETGLASVTPFGRSSCSEAWVNGRLGSLLVMTMDNRLISPAHIVAELKLLRTEGGNTPPTLRVALAEEVLLIVVPSPVDVNALAGSVLIRFPGVTEVTSIATVQDPGTTPD